MACLFSGRPRCRRTDPSSIASLEGSDIAWDMKTEEPHQYFLVGLLRARNTIFCVVRDAAEVKRSRDLRFVEADGVAPVLLARSLSVVGTDGPGQLPLDHPQHPDRRRVVATCGR